MAEPDAKEILREARAAQSAQHITLLGQLRNGSKTTPFRMVLDGNITRYQFTDPPLTIQLRLLDSDSKLEEITDSGTQKVTPARFDDPVRGSDISYEDFSLKFLYWANATVTGEQTMLLRKCWIVRVEPPRKTDSQYSRVMLWIDQTSGTLLQAEAFDHNSTLAKRFKVISGQTIDGRRMLKEMRIEVGPRDRSPTYLRITGSENP